MKTWHEEDDFWEKWQCVLFPKHRWELSVRDIADIIHLLDVQAGSHVLDLCCGPGRHTIELAAHGFNVTAVDRTEYYLNQARQLANEKELSIDFICEDMRTFIMPDSFDLVLNLFTSFGYFEDKEDDKKVVDNVFKSLKKGGRFLIDLMGKEVLARLFRERDWYEVDGITLLEERKLHRNWSWIESRWIMMNDDDKMEHKISHRLYAASELIDLFRDCGFSYVRAYGDLSGNPYDQNASRLVVTGIKN